MWTWEREGGNDQKCELRYVIKDGRLQDVEIRTWKKDRQVEHREHFETEKMHRSD